MAAPGAEAEVLAAEAERCRAINEKDWSALEQLIRDDITHTHVRGMTQDKAGYLENVKSRPRTLERRDLEVRVFGDAAVMTGTLINNMAPPGSDEPRLMEATVLQVWARADDGAWQLAAFQGTLRDGG